jgi:transcription elongation factor GreA
MGTIFFTREKFELIKNEYQKLLSERKDAVFHLAKAREMGDLSENGYYRASKSKLSSIDFNLRRLSGFIKYGSIINFVNKGLVEIGCRVTVKNEKGLIKYQIVGKEEADPAKGKISNESPLGKLLLGKMVGNDIELNTSSGMVNYNIIKIE